MEKFFSIEDIDRVFLDNPKEENINKGGFFYYAKMNHDIVGSIALLKNHKTNLKLLKW